MLHFHKHQHKLPLQQQICLCQEIQFFYSNANIIGSGFNKNNTGASYIWDFSSLTKLNDSFDVYRRAAQVNITYGITISPSAYGFKVSDSIPGLGSLLPVSINDIYNFFNIKSSPSRFVTEGFAAKISNIPTPINYTDEDELYFLPLQYGDSATSTFNLAIPIPTLGGVKMKGTRTTNVDGWGVITTPYFTTPVNCLRVRSEVDEIDSVLINFIKVGIPRKTVEYKFLVQGKHYPALWVTSTIVLNNETVTSIKYRDSNSYTPDTDTTNNDTTNTDTTHNTSIYANPYNNIVLNVYPNPSNNSHVTIDIPQHWNKYVVSLYDIQGRMVLTQKDLNKIDLSTLQAGQYVIQVIGNGGFGYAIIQNE